MPGASPEYDEPEMVPFFDGREGWEFLYKTEVDHCGAGAGVVYVQGVETNGAQPGDGLFRLRLPAVFVSQKDLNGALPAPGLLVRNGLAEPVGARYNNGVNDGIRRLFAADLTVADGAGAVPDDEEWWRGALLATNDASGSLSVASPFGQDGIPDDAVLTLAVSGIAGHDNPFAGFAPLSWTADAAEGLGDPIPLAAPTASGAAAFVLMLFSPKYGLLARDRVKVSVVRVIVNWEPISSELSVNPNRGDGVRLYPGKFSPADTIRRDTVRLRASLSPPLPDRQVFLRILDVADPAFAVGYVWPDSTAPRLFMGGISPMLTVWRKLWIERDSMPPVPESEKWAKGYVNTSTLETMADNFGQKYSRFNGSMIMPYSGSPPSNDEFEGGNLFFKIFTAPGIFYFMGRDSGGPFRITKSKNVFGS